MPVSRKGKRQWECEWYELTTGARKRFNADPTYEHNHDFDEDCYSSVHATKDEAIASGKTHAPGSVYGCAIVQEQVWTVDEDRVGEWEPTGPQFEVDAKGDVGQV
jgi:hypothetical protein